MNETPNYYAIIPADVRYDKNLKDKAKLLYGEITALSNQYGYCYATNKYFADLYKVSITTISTLIKNLIDFGYIECEYTYKENTKEIDKRYLKILKGGYLKKFKGGIKENLKENNTSINNTSINNITTTDTIFDFLEKNGFVLTPIHYEIIQQWEDTELTRYAIKQAVVNNKYNIKYIQQILNSYQKENIKTVQQAIEREEQFIKKKNYKKEENVPKWFYEDLGRGGFDDDGENF